MKLNGKLIFLLCISFLVRLLSLNQSLWLDETTTANVVRNLGYLDIITKFSPHDFHPPFFYLLMKFWTNIFGYGEVSLRMPSVLASLVAGYVVYKLAENAKLGQSKSLWASAFFLFNPLIVYYSQEARMYSLVTLLITLVAYFAFKIKSESQKKFSMTNVIFANLFIFLSLITFYGSVFFIATLYLYLLFKRKYKLITYILPGTLLSSVLLYPFFMTQLHNSGEVLKAIPNWSLTLGKANLKNLVLVPLKLTSGRLSFEPKWLYFGISGIWVSYIGYMLARVGLQSKKFTVLFYYLKTPVLLGFIVSFYKPMLQYFRFIYIVPFLSILLVASTHKKWERFLLLSGFVFFSLLYLLNPSFHREDWRTLVASLTQNKVALLPSSVDPVKYYDPTIKTYDIRSLRTGDESIVVIPYAEQIYGVDHAVLLSDKKYKLKSTKIFRGLTYEIWSQK